MTVQVHPTAAGTAAALADLVTIAVGRGERNIALAGGSTPLAAYGLLAEAAGVDWSTTTLWIGDERWVPVDHPDSNAGAAREAFVDAVGAELLAPDYGLGDPHASAADYEARLDEVFARDGGPGLVLLGVGDDGHTASLFPGTEALDVDRAGFVANWVPTHGVWRLTATLPLIWAARRIVFAAVGEAKAAVVAEIIDGAVAHPAQRAASGGNDVTWLLDAAAASHLRKHGT